MPAVHPHGRGDHRLSSPSSSSDSGSPPRAWGPHIPAHENCHIYRFTPTGVGTTEAPGGRGCCCPVHPHGRGDHFPKDARKSSAPGSPPRAWGPLSRKRINADDLRFTPTGVGTTSGGDEMCVCGPVHPHGRGDHFCNKIFKFIWYGSPPRAWGPLLGLSNTGQAARFTPTGVGTTRASRRPERRRPVHPHGRGDHSYYC